MSNADSGSYYSPSVTSALEWASAVARVRERIPPGAPSTPQVAPADLFIGVLLAHADPDGELPVLLDHFGITARDVVGEAYAHVTAARLEAVLPDVSRHTEAPGSSLIEIFNVAGDLARGPVQLLHVLGGLLDASSPLAARLDQVLGSVGESRAAVWSSYREWLSGRPQANDVAGQSLRAWLVRQSPRTPVSVAGFATDSVGATVSQPDFVGIAPESNALAYLVAARDLVPPLAIGLFGDWGSGKSFLMRDVRTRIDRLVELSGDTPQSDAAVWQHIRHIEFNAWEYVQGDLWAALLEKVFGALDSSAIQSTLVKARQAPIVRELEIQGETLKLAKEKEEALEGDRRAAAAKVQQAQQRLDQREAEAAAHTPTVDDAIALAKSALAEQWNASRIEGLGQDVDDLTGALQDAWNELRAGRQLLGPYWRNWKHIALATVIAATVALATWGLQTLTDIPAVSAVLAAVAIAIPAVTGWLRSVTRWAADQRGRIQEALAELDAVHRQPVEAARSELADSAAALADTEAALEEQRTIVAAEADRVARLTDDVSAITPGRVFVEFVAQRSADYRSRLGLLGVVRDDLRQLQFEIDHNNEQAILAKPGAAPPDHGDPTPNRIVLYIDDLDRCPPSKVVQVLEAVHLLLAFRLFVVFVAVDSRWLSSALVEQLHALRGDDDDTPTARDYLEKIFQLPFWVQPLSQEARGSVASGLLAGSVRSDDTGELDPRGGLELKDAQREAITRLLAQSGSGLRLETSALSLSADELAFVTGLGPLLGDTPRSVKRFVNIVQFLLSIRPAPPGTTARPARHALALYAAIHEGLPSVSQQVFAPAPAPRTLGTVIDTDDVDDSEKEILRSWLDRPGNNIWRDATVAELGAHTQMVQRLGFGRPTTDTPSSFPAR